MAATIDQLLFADRIVGMLAAAFGALAVVLAAVGLFGVLGYAVARRTREIGVRVALGADRRRILRLVFGEVAALAGAGLAIGLPCGYALGRLIQSRLFGLTALDPPTLAGATLILGLTAALAGTLPALRAARVDPSVALRYE
jgi:ABC-type antimicrobial peptide transport system permease subunit